jgi:hypothetical protein
MRAVLVCGLMAVAAIVSISSGFWSSNEDVIYDIRRSAANATGTAFGWSGYAIEHGQNYSSVSGSWIVPRVSYQNYPGYSQAEFSSTWIGIGGDNNDQTLIQLGTTQNVDASGTTKYYAWYLLVSELAVPAAQIPYPVEPGDKITASLRCVSNCTPNAQQSWAMSMTNSTKGWTWNNNGAPFSYKSTMASAEWIMEDPVLQGPGALPMLPKYGSVTFTDVTANGANPSLSLTTDAITMVAPDGSPTSIPTAASGNSFTVNQVGLPPAVPLPNQPTLSVCNGATDLGDFNSQTVVGLLGIGQEVDYRFYLPAYDFMTTFPINHPNFNFLFVDDSTGAQIQPVHGDQNAPIFVSLDPGYYCLKVFSATAPNEQFRVQMSTGNIFIRPSSTRAQAVPLAQFDIGNLTPNGYYGKSRYINADNHNNLLQLVPDHIYTLRDWVGGGATDQFYAFSIDASRNVTVELGNLYLGARTTIETAAGEIVAETVDAGIPLRPRPPGQQFNGPLPAGTYYLHVAFAGVGLPGTPYAIALTAH